MGRPCGCCRCDTEVPSLTPLVNSDRLDVLSNYSNTLPSVETLVATNCSLDSITSQTKTDNTGTFVELTITLTTTAPSARLILGYFPAAAVSTGVRPNAAGWAWQNGSAGWSFRNAYQSAALALANSTQFPGINGWTITSPTMFHHINGAAETLGLINGSSLGDCWSHSAVDSFFRTYYGDSTGIFNHELLVLAGGGSDWPDLAGEAADPGTWRHGAGVNIKTNGTVGAGTYVVKLHVANIFASRTRSPTGVPFAFLETTDTFELSWTDGSGAQTLTMDHRTSADIGSVPTWTTPHPLDPGTQNIAGHSLSHFARQSDTGDYAMTWHGRKSVSFSGGDYMLDAVLMVARNGLPPQLNQEVDHSPVPLVHMLGWRLYINLVGDYEDSGGNWHTTGTYGSNIWGTELSKFQLNDSQKLLIKGDGDEIIQNVDDFGSWLNTSGFHIVNVVGTVSGDLFQPLTGETSPPRSNIPFRLELNP